MIRPRVVHRAKLVSHYVWMGRALVWTSKAKLNQVESLSNPSIRVCINLFDRVDYLIFAIFFINRPLINFQIMNQCVIWTRSAHHAMTPAISRTVPKGFAHVYPITSLMLSKLKCWLKSIHRFANHYCKPNCRSYNCIASVCFETKG